MARVCLIAAMCWGFAVVQCSAGPIEASETDTVGAPPRVKLLFATTLLMKRLEPVGLTEAQRAECDRLARELATAVRARRAEVDIGRELIKHRDAVYGGMRREGRDPADEGFWDEFQRRTGVTDPQREVFEETPKLVAAYRVAVMALLTPEQKRSLPKRGKRKAAAETPAEGSAD
ncbi:MAG: hypothetical protein AAF532_16200 [Planctomycetota bacterium]